MSVTLTLDHWIAADRRVFKRKKSDIESALKGDTGIVDGVTEENREDIFYMLMFCLCVPQSKAIKAEEAIEILRARKFYHESLSLAQIIKILTGKVRFQSVKAARLVRAKATFKETDFWEELSSRYLFYSTISDDAKESALHSVRNFLMDRISGMGMKLSSHFMRNIGMGGLAILDVHIMSGLKKRGVIWNDKLGPAINEYLEIEQKMKDYAEAVGISLDQLDLLLWSQKTGYVFK
jgi:N-glycosylase/DNA lyase